MSEMVEMPEGARWDGYPVFGRDRDAWHLLNFDEAEHPVPMWWDWRSESWFSDPDSNIALKAADAEAAGYWYLAGTVTPSDLNDAIAEAVAAERERCAKVCENERLGDTSGDPTDISYGVAIEHCIQAIRSAAK